MSNTTVRIKKNPDQDAELHWKVFCPFCQEISDSEYEQMGVGSYHYYCDGHNCTYYCCGDGWHEFFIDYKDLEDETEEVISTKFKNNDGWYELPLLKIVEIIDNLVVGYSSDVKLDDNTVKLMLDDVNTIRKHFYYKSYQTLEEQTNMLKKFDFFKYFETIDKELDSCKITEAVLKNKYNMNPHSDDMDFFEDIHFNISRRTDIYYVEESGLNVIHDGTEVLCKLENGDKICLSGD